MCPTILIVTEHGLDPDRLKLIKLEGYNLVTEFSRHDHKLGGVAMYIKDTQDLKVEEINIKDYCQELVFEAGLIRVNAKKQTLHILGIYHPPSSKTKEAIEAISNILNLIRGDIKPLILMGDINLDRLDTKNPGNTLLEEELLTFGITRLPLPATRITSITKTSIDCICTNLPEDKVCFNIIQGGMSDHTGQLCEILTTTTNDHKQGSAYKRNFNKQNLDYLKSELAGENWDEVHNTQDAELAYNAFHKIVINALNLTCPNKTARTKPKKKQKTFYDDEVNVLRKDFLQSLRMYELTGTIRDKETMAARKKNYDLKLRDLKRKAASEHIINSNNKSKAMWTIINAEKQRSHSSGTPIHLEIGGEMEENPTLIAEHLNNYFLTVADLTLEENKKQFQSVETTFEDSIIAQCNHTLSLTPTEENEVLQIIGSLKPKLSCGIDEVSSKVLKHCARQLSTPLVSIINKSFSSGHFPSLLKVAKVYPKHKKGKTTKTENYRPISLISTFSKIIEKIALKRMLLHLENRGLITESQHGFLKGRSTITAITSLIEHITDQLEDGKHVSAVLLDYSKAFDCLGHELILDKLSTLGFKDTSKKWIASYLRGRSQIVEVQTSEGGRKLTFRSKPSLVSRGVPQGSVLGPFLFVLFTNDFPMYLGTNNIKTIMYADDTTLVLARDNAQDLSSQMLSSTNKAIQYCLQNNLAINPSKTVHMNFSRKHDPVSGSTDTPQEKQAKLLGITIDCQLTWTAHIINLCKTLSKGVFVVRRMKWIGGPEAARTAYFALVESHLRYGIAVWGGTSVNNLNKVLILQKRAIRILADLNPQDSCREAFKSLKILTIVGLYILAVVTNTEHIANQRGENLHVHNTRRATDFILPRHRTTKYSKKPSYTGCKMYNALPQHLKALSGRDLKRSLQGWLIERPLYTVNEYYELTNM